MSETRDSRTIGLLGATGVGVGAIVGGGIFVLAGVAFASTGPGAVLAFALNGVIAVLTALSFAEMSANMPVNGGPYTFAKRVLSVRAAFGVGWILWFAYIVAAVLYGLGFASYAVLALTTLLGDTAPDWLTVRAFGLALACAAVLLYTLGLIRSAGGGRDWATVGKLVIFAVLLAAGLAALVDSSPGTVAQGLSPLLPAGATGLLAAMGYTFIAVQGFDLVSAIAGEVKDPGRNIPRAMLLSLGTAMLIYLPLLFIVSTVGVEQGQSIGELSEAHPDTVMALAVERFMGRTGYWLVVVAAILATLSALRANLLAASRVAAKMAQERTLPSALGALHPTRRTPVTALYASALGAIAITLALPNVAAAGAAASLIFLLTFSLAHGTAILARLRGGVGQGAFRTPWFPLVPLVGGLACLALVVFQAVVEPSASLIVVIWIGLGGLAYLMVFANRAEAMDAGAEARDPELVRLRGRNPLVLAPLANPDKAAAMVGIANAMATPNVGRVLLLTVVGTDGGDPSERLDSAQRVVTGALRASLASNHRPEALMTLAAEPWDEIVRVVRVRQCESLLLGLTHLEANDAKLEALMNAVDCDVAILHARDDWNLNEAKRVLVPMGGRSAHDSLRARLLGTLVRTAPREVTFLRVMPSATSDAELEAVRRELDRFADEEAPGHAHAEVIRSQDVEETIRLSSTQHDLTVLGLQRLGRRRKTFGPLALSIARASSGATILLSRR